MVLDAKAVTFQYEFEWMFGAKRMVEKTDVTVYYLVLPNEVDMAGEGKANIYRQPIAEQITSKKADEIIKASKGLKRPTSSTGKPAGLPKDSRTALIAEAAASKMLKHLYLGMLILITGRPTQNSNHEEKVGFGES